jgi:hypothetical protein
MQTQMRECAFHACPSHCTAVFSVYTAVACGEWFLVFEGSILRWHTVLLLSVELMTVTFALSVFLVPPFSFLAPVWYPHKPTEQA